MRKAPLGGWMLAAVLLAAMAVPAQADREINLFFNNFDNTTAGALPSPWEIVYDGTGTSQQVVSRDYAFSGNQSMKLAGRLGWSAVVQRRFEIGAPVLGTQFYILIPRYGTRYGEFPALFCQSAESKWGTFYGTVIFDHSTRQILDERDNKPLLGWSPGVWYKVRTLVDRVDLRAKIWVNNQLVVDGTMVGRSHPEWINALGLGAGHSGIPVYYDNVKVFLPGVQEMGGLLLDEIDGLVSRGELSTANANQLRTQILGALDNEQGGDYGAAMDGLRAFLATAETWARPGSNPVLNVPPTLFMKNYDHMTRLGEQMILQIQYRLKK